MLFDRSSGELPCATVRSQSGMAGYVGDLQRWLGARWTWFRPRMVPVVVALIGLVGLLESGRYLSDMAKGVNAPDPYHGHLIMCPDSAVHPPSR